MPENRVFGQNLFGTQSTSKAGGGVSAWRYVVSAVIVAVGLVYALPNLFPPDPAIQVQTDNAKNANGEPFHIGDSTVGQFANYLREEGVDVKSAEHLESMAIIRLQNNADQLRAKTLLEQRLNPAGMDRQFVVALNLAETTPDWLADIGGKPMTLGLDLAGGIHFVLQVDMTQAIESQLEDENDKILSDLRDAGIRYVAGSSEFDDRSLRVYFATSDSRSAAFSVLSDQYGPPDYEFDEVDNETGFAIQLTITEDRLREVEDVAIEQNLTGLRSRVNELNVSEPLVQRQGRTRVIVDLPGVQDSAEAKRIIGKFATLEFHLVAKPQDRPSQIEILPYEGREIRINKSIIVTGDNVINAIQSRDPETSLPQVNFTLDSTGGERLHDITSENVGHSMAIVFIEQKPVVRTKMVDGEPVPDTIIVPERRLISVATIESALGYKSRITGLDVQEARELALLLRAGALAAPMYFVEERTVGASLGAENIDRGVLAVTIGFALVLAFMLVYYKVFGFVANIALTLNLVILVAIMSILGATLTLPGIAGIVLTVGMAVDANVLIFSRIREELKHSMPHVAIPAGYNRAFLTILDANLTTLFVALILLTIGSGPIAGFAVTLSIGIVTSMFTAVFVSRGLVHLIYGYRRVEKVWI
ncbi:MAG: protein translocase subunit SecD [Gammaproteobacteria bacterium]|nr:protein translocase subunit SecD [Gammaproteobacteria bacterium]